MSSSRVSENELNSFSQIKLNLLKKKKASLVASLTQSPRFRTTQNSQLMISAMDNAGALEVFNDAMNARKDSRPLGVGTLSKQIKSKSTLFKMEASTLNVKNQLSSTTANNNVLKSIDTYIPSKNPI